MKITLPTQSFWTVAQKADVDPLFPGKNSMIQAVKDISEIIDPSLNAKLTELFLKKGSFAKKFSLFLTAIRESLQTPIQGFEIAYDGSYYIKAYCYHNLKDQHLYLFPLSWLPQMRKVNKKLFEIMIASIALLYRRDVTCFEEQKMWDDYLRETIQDDIEYNKETYTKDEVSKIIRELALWDEYGSKYQDMFYQRKFSVEKLEKMISNYKPGLSAELIILNFAKMLLKAIKQPQDMSYFEGESLNQFARYNELEMDEDDEPQFLDGYPLTIKSKIQFCWFAEGNVREQIVSYASETAGNFGEAEYSKEYECRTRDELKEAYTNFVDEIGNFPEYLAEAIEYANEHEEVFYDYVNQCLTQTLFPIHEFRT